MRQCRCAEIGIDSAWADSNAVTCHKIRVNQIVGVADKGKLELAAIYARRTGDQDAGPLLYLHGGPGLSTISNGRRYLSNGNWKSLRQQHDIIMFDYRGTGFSEPSLCEDLLDSLKALRMTNLSQETMRLRERELYLKCRASLPERGIDITGFNSIQMAADADAVREAMRIKKWNVYGVSYGTMVALQYVRRFPNQLRSIVLDSSFPPNAPSFDFIHTMNEALVQMHKKLQNDSLTAATFPDIIGDFSNVASRLNKAPIKINGMNFTGDDFAGAMVMSFYNTKVVPLIPLALKEFASGNDTLLTSWVLSLSSPEQHGKVNEFQSALIDCYECKPTKPEDSPDSLAARYPYLAALSRKAYLDLCYQFRPETPGAESSEAVKSDLPVLLMAGEFDPGTPPSFGQVAARSLTNSTLIVVPNASHAAMHYNQCSFSIVRSFLQDPSIKPDTACISEIEPIRFVTDSLGAALTELKAK